MFNEKEVAEMRPQAHALLSALARSCRLGSSLAEALFRECAAMVGTQHALHAMGLENSEGPRKAYDEAYAIMLAPSSASLKDQTNGDAERA